MRSGIVGSRRDLGRRSRFSSARLRIFISRINFSMGIGSADGAQTPLFFRRRRRQRHAAAAMILRDKALVEGSDARWTRAGRRRNSGSCAIAGIALFRRRDGREERTIRIVVAAARWSRRPRHRRGAASRREVVDPRRAAGALFNAAHVSIGVGRNERQVDDDGNDRLDLHDIGRKPTVMNGAVMKNFITADDRSRARSSGRAISSSARSMKATARSPQFSPRIAVLNNIALDHKSMDELRLLFRGSSARRKPPCSISTTRRRRRSTASRV